MKKTYWNIYFQPIEYVRSLVLEQRFKQNAENYVQRQNNPWQK